MERGNPTSVTLNKPHTGVPLPIYFYTPSPLTPWVCYFMSSQNVPLECHIIPQSCLLERMYCLCGFQDLLLFLPHWPHDSQAPMHGRRGCPTHLLTGRSHSEMPASHPAEQGQHKDLQKMESHEKVQGKSWSRVILRPPHTAFFWKEVQLGWMLSSDVCC